MTGRFAVVLITFQALAFFVPAWTTHKHFLARNLRINFASGAMFQLPPWHFQFLILLPLWCENLNYTSLSALLLPWDGRRVSPSFTTISKSSTAPSAGACTTPAPSLLSCCCEAMYASPSSGIHAFLQQYVSILVLSTSLFVGYKTCFTGSKSCFDAPFLFVGSVFSCLWLAG